MKKLLALNRGEIAIRIFRAANELGLRTVAVYSKEDRLSLHRFKADEAYQIGENKGPVEAYLDTEGIVTLAAANGVDFIHPGYGFLSENPNLPRACAKAGITFVGPSATMLDALGDKTAARTLAEKAKIPVVPGTPEALTKTQDVERAAKSIGFPLIVKAAFGGGGRGMRVVNSAEEFKGKLEEARREAGAAFGNDAVFLERFIRRAKHIEIQIIADKHGNVVHLHERDCSVQRRHQKVVEVAPAVHLSEKIRKELAEAAVALAKVANYENAGTVEFLVDVDKEEWFFIEVNPRVQVEHTVTEMVTGIDIVRTQIQVAMGHKLHGPEINLPKQEDIKVNGFALQCRVTTEDPTQNFTPDYGRIHTYRSPAGFGIRLDGASAYGGAVITPFYDSLLVKTTSWGRDFNEACQRMDRALREFRIRGVKTNIPFLENVINNDTFQKGDVTTRFLEETPALFKFIARRDRATKLLTYLGETIVNGNPEVAGKPKPATFRKPKIEAYLDYAPPKGTRQLLDELGPEKFAQWTRDQKRLLITDTTFRDAHQSLIATRMRTYDMMAVANFVAHRLSGLYSLEMWGGATFDVSMRFLLEDPWQRLRRLREAIPNICFQMLLRASNAVGYTAYPDNVVREFIIESAAQGIDIFRVFDSLNYLPNMKVAMAAVRKTNRICEAAICYTGDILDPKRTKYSLNYYVRMAKELEKMGAHVLAIKDMAGLAKPYATEILVKALKEEIGIPIHFHTHDSSGLNGASILKASDAKVDVADAAVASMSGSTSQPNLNSIVASLANTKRDTGLDSQTLLEYSEYWEAVRHNYSGFDSSPRHGLADLYIHEMPGGQYTNLREQANAMGLGHRWREIARTYADVNQLFGDIVKVTPSSKVVGDMCMFLVTRGIKAADVPKLKPGSIDFPESVIDMLSGGLGQPDGGWPVAVQKVVLGNRKATTLRPGELADPIDLEATRTELTAKLGRPANDDDLYSHLMYPQVFADFTAFRAKYDDLSSLPTPAFFYGLQIGEEIEIEIDTGKILIIKLISIGEADSAGRRALFYELNGMPRESIVTDNSLKSVSTASRQKGESDNPAHGCAPMPGMVTEVAVSPGQEVKAGDKLVILEAMKMLTTVSAGADGVVSEILVKKGDRVDSDDLLVKLTTV